MTAVLRSRASDALKVEALLAAGLRTAKGLDLPSAIVARAVAFCPRVFLRVVDAWVCARV